MSVTKLTKDNFKETISSGIVLAAFGAPWCPDCGLIDPYLENICNDYEDVTVGKLNEDMDQDVAEEFKIKSIPVIIIFKDSKEARRLIVPRNEEMIREALDSVIRGE